MKLSAPRGTQGPGTALMVGYDWGDYDLAQRMTARFLMKADRRQVEAVMNGILAADSQLTEGRILRRLLDPTEGQSDWGYGVFRLHNGTDGITPPAFIGRVFPEDTNHYIASGATALDSQDVLDAVKLVTRKGYGITPGSQMLIICNDDEADAVMSWRAGQASRTDGPVSPYDFVPSRNAPVYLTEKNIVGELAPGDFHGIPVLGSYGESWLCPTPVMPAGYVVVTASYGPNHQLNPVGFRPSPLPAYQGLRQIAGPWTGYPLLESFHVRNFGVGVRHRGASAVIRVGTEAEYVAPTKDQLPDYR